MTVFIWVMVFVKSVKCKKLDAICVKCETISGDFNNKIQMFLVIFEANNWLPWNWCDRFLVGQSMLGGRI